MAITKEEAKKFISDVQKTEIAVLESKIDSAIKALYTGSENGSTITIGIATWPGPKVKEELTRMYSEKGWKIEFHSDQREGNWIELK